MSNTSEVALTITPQPAPQPLSPPQPAQAHQHEHDNGHAAAAPASASAPAGAMVGHNDLMKNHTPLQLIYRDLQFVVKDKITKKDTAIVKGVNGCFNPGRLTAIMGASGAGKTSLLNLVSGQASGGVISGDMLVNGEIVKSDFMPAISGFVHQGIIHTIPLYTNIPLSLDIFCVVSSSNCLLYLPYHLPNR
jgi:ABC-type transport system involved in cytochrome bd biosynthesis fused ATPase/permease subunit